MYHDDSEAIVQTEFLKRRLLFLSGRLCRKQQWEEGEEEEVFHVVELEDKVKATPWKADALWMLLVPTGRREYEVETIFVIMLSAKKLRVMTF